MRDFEHCINVLLKVTEEGIPFSLAINSSLKNDKKISDHSLRGIISSSCGGLLRHYYALMKNVENAYEGLDEKNKLILALCLSNKLFSKMIDEEKLLAYAKKETSINDINKFLEKYNSPADLISEDVVVDSDEYFHLKCNLPLWLVKMWRKNLGDTLSTKLFKTLTYTSWRRPSGRSTARSPST